MNRRTFLFASAASFFGLSIPASVAAAMLSEARPAPGFVALIIDDIGYSRCRAARFLRLPVPITYAVLPRLPLTRSLAAEIHGAGHELLLHQPMEPVDGRFDPGPGALYVRDEPGRIDDVIAENLKSVCFAAGVNNHMGSRFTAAEVGMRAALTSIKRRSRFFVDSVTSRRSAGLRTARGLDLPCARRHVFLDNDRDPGAIFGQLRHLGRIALSRGRAVGIGHPFPETAAAIARFFQTPAASRLKPVYVSSLLTRHRG